MAMSCRRQRYNVLRSSCKASDFKQMCSFLTDFHESPQHQTLWKSVQCEPRWYIVTYIQTDRRKDIMNLNGAFRDYGSAPRNDSKANENSEKFSCRLWMYFRVHKHTACECTSVCTSIPHVNVRPCAQAYRMWNMNHGKLHWCLSSSFNRSGRPRKGVELYLYSFFNFGARWGLFNATPPALHLRERDTVRIVQVAGWAPGTDWTGTENRNPSEIRSPDQPFRSQSQEYLSFGQYLSVQPTTSNFLIPFS